MKKKTKKVKLEIKIRDVKFHNPVTAASGTFGTSDEYSSFVDYRKLGAIISKTITVKPRVGNPMPRICEVSSGMLNAIGLQNKGLDDFIYDKIKFFRKIKTPLIVSIAGESTKEFSDLARRLGEMKDVVKAIEINFSCPNVDAGGANFMKKKEKILDVMKAVRDNTDTVVIAKLSPELGDIIEISGKLIGEGVDALSLINTLKGMAIDIYKRTSKLAKDTGGLSGPAIKPIALRHVCEVKRAFNIPIIASGGISTWADAIEFIIAGADLLAVGTANFVQPKSTISILEGIEKYCLDQSINDINKLRGTFLNDINN